ncbi:MAG TPA: hypothetical protein VHW60_18680 [Caulobacteraceae bacterium]|jgi:hypothetical protein|nr:hypothetical protein [Caulobacteraceae bacterium]
MLATLLALTTIAIVNPPGLPPGALGPPWPAVADERPVPDSPTFKPCHDALQMLATRLRARIDEPRFAHSAEWGWIMRAKLTSAYGPADITQFFTCWSVSGQRFKVAIRPEHMFGPPPAD